VSGPALTSDTVPLTVVDGEYLDGKWGGWWPWVLMAPWNLDCRRLVTLALQLKSSRGGDSHQAQRPGRHPQLSTAHSSASGSSVGGGGTYGRASGTMGASEDAAAKAETAGAHRSPSAAKLSAMTNILNARDLAEASPVLKLGGDRPQEEL
jgi:hypothetical protein